MKRFVPWVVLISGFIYFTGIAAGAGDPKLPVIRGKEALATVNGEPVTLDQFLRTLASIHEEAGEKQVGGKKNLSSILDRLINIRLIYQEARNIGLDELEEVKSAVEEYRKKTLRAYLYGYHVRNIKKAKTEDVEKIYKESVKEVKVASLLIGKEEDSKALEAALKSGEDYDELARGMVLEGKAEGGGEGQYLKMTQLNPVTAAAVAKLKIGEISPVLPLGKKYTILKLEDIRIPEDPQAREKAEAEALSQAKIAEMNRYAESLKKKHAKIKEDLLESLDFDAKEPGIVELMADKRVVVQVQGSTPVTVGELAEAVSRKYFHGPERMAAKRKLNLRKREVLNEILLRKLFDREAIRLKIDRTPEYKAKVVEFKEETVFGAFVSKAILPDLKIDEAEIRAFYEGHISEFRSSDMFKIRILAFTERGDAEEALEKLINGADLQWVLAYAPGKIDPENARDLFEWGGRALSAEDLPGGVQQAISGAKSGDFRFYASPEGPSCVLYIEEVHPARTRSFEEMKGILAEKIRREKSMEILNSWLVKLKAVYKVKIFAREDALQKIIEKRVR